MNKLRESLKIENQDTLMGDIYRLKISLTKLTLSIYDKLTLRIEQLKKAVERNKKLILKK